MSSLPASVSKSKHKRGLSKERFFSFLSSSEDATSPLKNGGLPVKEAWQEVDAQSTAIIDECNYSSTGLSPPGGLSPSSSRKQLSRSVSSGKQKFLNDALEVEVETKKYVKKYSVASGSSSRRTSAGKIHELIRLGRRPSDSIVSALIKDEDEQSTSSSRSSNFAPSPSYNPPAHVTTPKRSNSSLFSLLEKFVKQPKNRNSVSAAEMSSPTTTTTPPPGSSSSNSPHIKAITSIIIPRSTQSIYMMPRSTSLQFMPSTVTRKRALSDKHEVMQKEAFNTFQQAAAPIRKSQSMLIDLTELKMDVGEDMNGEGVNSLTRINYPVKNSTSLDSVDSSKLSSKISSTNSPKANSPKGSPMGSPKVARTVSPSSSAKTSVKNLLKNAFSKSSSSLLSNKQKSASASALHSEDSLFENASKDSLLALDLQLSYLYSPAINSGGRDEGGSESPKGGVFNGDLNCSEEGSSSSASTRQQRDRVKMDIFKRAPKAAQMLLPPDNNNASGVNKKKKNSFAMQQSKKWLTKMLSGSHHPLPKPPDSMDPTLINKCEADEILLVNQLGKRIKVKITLSANIENMKQQIFSVCGIEVESEARNFDFCFLNAELRESPPIDDLKLLSYIQKTGKNYNDLDLLAITQNTGLMSKRTKKLTKSQTITRPSAQFIAERLEKFFPGIEGINLEPSAAPSITTSGNNGSVGSNPSVSISMTESRSDINNNVNPPEKLHHFNRRPVGDALSARRVSRQDFNYLASLPQSSLRNSSFFTDFGEPTSCDTPVSTKSFQLASAFSIRISQSKASMNIKDIVLEKVEIQRQESVRKRDTIRTRRQKLREGYRPALKKIHSTTFHDDYRESAEILNDVDLVTSRMEKDIKQMEQEADKIFHSINDEDVLKKPLSSPLPATTPSPAATTTATVTEPHPDSAFWSPSKDELKLQRIEEGRVKGQPIIPSISLSDGVPPLALNDKMVPEIGLVSGSDDEEESRIEMWYQGDMIGQGAYGRVYLGLNFKNWELMAVKQVEIGKFEFKKGEMTPEEAIQKEIGILKTLNDINIVRYFDCEITDMAINIFLEYVPGGSIYSVLAKAGRFPDPLVRSLSFQILNGLDYLHSVGIIHRDVKTANILLDLEGIAKLSDFGVSKRVADPKDVYVRQSTISMRGTPHWMAPEVVSDEGYSAKADIWSFGCVIIEMLSGQRPWEKLDMELQVFRQLGKKNHPPLPIGISQDATSIIMECFNINDDVRMTALQLLDMPYVNGIDPLDTNFFNFKAFYEEAEEHFKNLSEIESSDEYIDTE